MLKPREEFLIILQTTGITHRRRFALDGTRVLFVLDDITGPEGEEHLIEQCWHGNNLVIASTAPIPAEQKEVWRSRCLGSKEPSQAKLFRWRATFPVRVATASCCPDQPTLPCT